MDDKPSSVPDKLRAAHFTPKRTESAPRTTPERCSKPLKRCRADAAARKRLMLGLKKERKRGSLPAARIYTFRPIEPAKQTAYRRCELCLSMLKDYQRGTDWEQLRAELPTEFTPDEEHELRLGHMSRTEYAMETLRKLERWMELQMDGSERKQKHDSTRDVTNMMNRWKPFQ